MNEHANKHQHPHQQQRHESKRMRRHHLVILIGVILMLAGMAAYLMSGDEAFAPVEGQNVPMPADAPAE